MNHDFQNSIALNHSDLEFFTFPTIKSQLPVAFPNGLFWDAFTAKCPACHALIEAEKFRGMLRRQTDHVAEIHALAHCTTCGHRASCQYRLHDDWRVSGRLGKTWVVWQGKEPFVDWCRRQANRILAFLF